MDRLWDSFFDGRPGRRVEVEPEWLPALDVAETTNQIVVKAEVPGMEPMDSDISCQMGCLPSKGRRNRRGKRRKRITMLSKGVTGLLPDLFNCPKKSRAIKSPLRIRMGF